MMLRSDLMYEADEFSDAETRIDRALEKEPSSALWRLRQAGLFYAMGRFPRRTGC